MVLCSVGCIDRVTDYLEVSTKKVYSSTNNNAATDDLLPNQTVEGFSTIIQALAIESKCPNILGKDSITRSLTRQWLEYAVLYVNYADVSANAKRILKEINFALNDKTYITGANKTIADIVLYYALHSVMNRLSNQNKADYINVSRWFDNLQQEEKLRQQLNHVNFDLMHLYL